MWTVLRLLLPALIPSWRFFRSVEASPRIQWTFAENHPGDPTIWREFRPRPDRVSPLETLVRLFWNPVWNETLFLVSCAERIEDTSDPHAIAEIRHRVVTGLRRSGEATSDQPVRFRIVFVDWQNGKRHERIAFESDPSSVTRRDAA
ncbi:MAG: hypothetical protein AAGD13_17570 [Pseudomonadota bacterium]